ncbi:MAG: taurine catabolism dioxygenase TauD [Acidobacteria bacterium]|nr:MAG: taurine catabolism dioxygenase TauD [Acidobacteriota bacterium]
MAERNLAAARLDRFKNITPKAVRLSEAHLIKRESLPGGGRLPLVIQPGAADVDLIEWATAHRAEIESELLDHGALLFRNFKLKPAADFERFAAALCPALFTDNGEHPRQNVSGKVYTPIFYPPDKKVLWHNENSFNHDWPVKIWFCCVQPAARGGETPLADSRKLYDQLAPSIRQRFSDKQVMYVRNYGRGPGLDWRTVFKTEDRAEVERQCRAARMAFEWTDGDGLRTRAVRPAVVKHPKTGQLVWFNQAQHWHIACLDAATRKALTSVFREADLPRTCYYGDGTVIEDSVMEEILALYQQLEVSFAWQERDILMLDNLLTAHARNPFAGARQLLVAMGGMLSYTAV